MKKIIMSVLSISVVFTILLTAASMLLPADWKIEREIVINAPAEKIFPLVTETDVNWQHKKIQNEKQKLISLDKNAAVQYEIQASLLNNLTHREISFLTDLNNTTKVNWVDWGETSANPVQKWTSFFVEALRGPAIEKSLANLKKISENE